MSNTIHHRFHSLMCCGLLLAACSGDSTVTPAAASLAQSAPAAPATSGGGATPSNAAPQEKPVPAAAPSAPASSTDPALTQIGAFIAERKIDTTKAGWRTSLPKPPQATFTEGRSYFWNLTTNLGDIKVKLLPDVAPMHVSNTIYLTQVGFYDTLAFHRVITGFMAQGGCPLGTGSGDPGYRFAGEFSPKVKHDKPGLLSMANAGPGTDGSQFFLTFVPTPHLDGKHTIFGEIVSGMDVLKKLEAAGSGSGQPKQRMTIDKATISVE